MEKPSATKTFPFFKLPRELRGLIYDHLKVAIDVTAWYYRPPDVQRLPHAHEDPIDYAREPSYTVIQTLVPHARLVCKQFTTEAETQFSKSVDLWICDGKERKWFEWDLAYVCGLEYVTNLHVFRYFCCMCPDRYANRHLCYTPDPEVEDLIGVFSRIVTSVLPRLPKISSIILVVALCKREDYEKAWSESPCSTEIMAAFQKIIKVFPMKRIELRKHRKFHVPIDPLLEDFNELWASWNEDTGWIAPKQKGNESV